MKNRIYKRFSVRFFIFILFTTILGSGNFQGISTSPGFAKPLIAAVPGVTVVNPSPVMLGASFDFTVFFDNTGSDTGYGPFIDLVFPITSSTGYPGIDYSSASYLGSTLEDDVQVFPDDGGGVGCVSHPWLRNGVGDYVDVCGRAGDKFVSLLLPFGSFVPTQPALEITVSASLSPLADISPDLTIRARGGYRFGETPEDDWCCGSPQDIPIATPSNPNSSTWPGTPISPQVMTFSKAYVGPDNTQDETATGPNFPRQYILTVNIASGQTLANLEIQDLLPDNLQFIEIDAGGTTSGYTINSIPSTTEPGGELTLNYPSASGTVTVTYNFYIPRLYDDSDPDLLFNNPVIDPDTGNYVESENNAQSTATWDPPDARGPEGLSSDTICPACDPLHTLRDKSIAVQKSLEVVEGGAGLGNDQPAPGAILEYTVEFQISDYFSFDNLVLTDTVADGQHVLPTAGDPSFQPSLQVDGNGFTLPEAPFDLLYYEVSCDYDLAITTPPNPPDSTECHVATAGTTGNTTLTFDISQEIIDRGENGRMLGGCVDPGGGLLEPCDRDNLRDGPTTATIIFRTQVLEEFEHDYPSGDKSVDQGDELGNSVIISGDVLDNADFSVNDSEGDNATAGVSIGRQTLGKNIYAINGETDTNLWERDALNRIRVMPGDMITYRLTYDLLTSDVEELTFDDYFPLPVFHVDDPDEDGVSGPTWTFAPTVPDPDYVPDPGVVTLVAPSDPNSGDTFYQYMVDGISGGTGTLTRSTFNKPLPDDPTAEPVIISNTAANKINIYYADYDDTRSESTTVDLLFSLIVSDDPFADGLYLTNMAHAFEGSTNAGTEDSDAIIQFVLNEPVLLADKGIVWTSNPNSVFNPTDVSPVGIFQEPSDPTPPRWTGTIDSDGLSTQPIDSNVSVVDAGDTITFAITIENQGNSIKGAFDIQLKDIIDTNYYKVPTTGAELNLQVYYGDGTGDPDNPGNPIPYRAVDGSCTALVDSHICGLELFQEGIELIDPVDPDQGICQTHDPNSGNNVIIITYDLELREDVIPGQAINTATLFNYAGEEDGPNHLHDDAPLEDDATAEVVIGLEKTVDSTEVVSVTNIDDFGNDIYQAVIGEIVTYKISAVIPEGLSPNTRIVDQLDGGLAFYSCDSVSVVADTGILTDLTPNDFSGVCTETEASGVSADGQTILFDLGSLINPERDDNQERIEIIYRVVVLNVGGVGGNHSGTLLDNFITSLIDDGSGDETISTTSAPDVTVIEPILEVTKNALPNTGDYGDTITFEIVLSHAGNSDTTAFDVVLADIVPPDMTYVGALSCTPAGGLAVPDTCAESAGTIDVEWFGPGKPFEIGHSATIRFDATLDVTVTPGEVITNTAEVQWTSLAGDVTTPRNPSIALSVERTGDDTGPGGSANDYLATGDGDVTIFSPSSGKIITGTNQSFTSGLNVAIGEQISYRTRFVIPEGTSGAAQLVDTLDAGLAFVSCDDVYVTETVPSSLSTTTAFDCSSVSFFDYPDSTPDNQGRRMVLDFGEVVNSDTNNATEESVTVEYTVVVINGGSNDRGDNRNNAAVWNWGASSTSTSAPDVTIVEPELLITKTASSASGDAGDIITFTIVILPSGLSDASAYDVIFEDLIPTGMSYYPGSLSCVPANGLAPYSTCAESGGTITAEWLGLTKPFEAGHSATIQFQATLDDSVVPNEVIINDAGVTWTSLPGDISSAQSLNNGLSVERTGDTNDIGGAVNDYLAEDDADVTVPDISFDKSVDPTTYTIGQTITYDLEVTLPEGTTDGLIVSDDIPVGLSYTSHNVDSSGYGGTLNPAPVVTVTPGSGGDITLDFGTTITASDGNPNNNSFIVEVLVLVLDVPSNLDGIPLQNTGRVQYDHGPDQTDDVDVWIFDNDKTLVGSLHGITTLPEVAIGEILTYEVVFIAPPVIMSNMHLVDTLDRGLAYVDCIEITAEAGLSTDIPGGFDAVCDNPVVSSYPAIGNDEDQGRQVDFDFGVLENAGVGTAQLTVRYRVVVLDSLGNQSGSTPPLNNRVEWVWDDGNFTNQAAGVSILEPDLYITKKVTDRNIIPGQVITYAITIGHTDESETSAYDVVMTDRLPSDLEFVPPVNVTGPGSPVVDLTGLPTIVVRWTELPDTGVPAVVYIDVTLEGSIGLEETDQEILNTASVSWTSLPDDFSAPQSTHNPLSTERFYDPLSNVNIYGIRDSITISIPALPGTGFAPNRLTTLPIQPLKLEYGDMDNMRLELPDLGKSIPIVSVPRSDQGWDLTWLWTQAGWLEGTAYPSWNGNSVITGHAYLSNGLPGPFVDLKELSWGDEILLYAHGYRYTYQVRSRELVSANDLSILKHKDRDWLTLFTCQDFNEVTDQYDFRQVVQAILIDVEEIQ